MSSKELILIVLAIIVAGCIIAGAILISSDTESPVNNTTAVNNTTNITENTTVEDITPSETSSSSQSTYNDEPYVDNYNTRGEVHHNGKTVVGQRYDPDLPGYVFVYDDGSTGTGG